MKSFHYYDRMYPSQDVSSSIGNLIALPLQGQALKNGNSAFVDENWNAYPNQWKVLLHETEKLGLEDIETYMVKWQGELAESRGVSEAQLRFVTNTASGMGLIKCGSVVIPFDNQISKDTDLYKLYNTNIHEIIEMKKHANEKCEFFMKC